jgi:hypothetical protein
MSAGSLIVVVGLQVVLDGLPIGTCHHRACTPTDLACLAPSDHPHWVLETRPVSRLPFQKRCSGDLETGLNDHATAISGDMQGIRYRAWGPRAGAATRGKARASRGRVEGERKSGGPRYFNLQKML